MAPPRNGAARRRLADQGRARSRSRHPRRLRAAGVACPRRSGLATPRGAGGHWLRPPARPLRQRRRLLPRRRLPKPEPPRRTAARRPPRGDRARSPSEPSIANGARLIYRGAALFGACRLRRQRLAAGFLERLDVVVLLGDCIAQYRQELLRGGAGRVLDSRGHKRHPELLLGHEEVQNLLRALFHETSSQISALNTIHATPNPLHAAARV